MPLSRFLIVDDSLPIRLVLRAALEKASEAGVRVVEASSPAEATEAFAREPFDLVLLDMVMGAEDGHVAGLGVLSWILTAAPRTRVVLMTSLPPEHPDVVSAMGIGAFAHLRKPVRLEAIRNLLLDVGSEEGTVGRIR